MNEFLPFWENVGKASYVCPQHTAEQVRWEVINRETFEAVTISHKVIISCTDFFKCGYDYLNMRKIDNDSLEV